LKKVTEGRGRFEQETGTGNANHINVSGPSLKGISYELSTPGIVISAQRMYACVADTDGKEGLSAEERSGTENI